jgi:hypothetical protein
MATVTRNIVNGPDRHALSVALFHGDQSEQIPITFSVESSQLKIRDEMKLLTAGREDGSGLNWNLVCYSLTFKRMVKIFYTLRDRTGTMAYEASVA